MADTTARQRYAGETKPVTVKQTSREELGAHPEYAGAKNKTEEATVTPVDVHSSHGGATIVDGGFR